MIFDCCLLLKGTEKVYIFPVLDVVSIPENSRLVISPVFLVGVFFVSFSYIVFLDCIFFSLGICVIFLWPYY